METLSIFFSKIQVANLQILVSFPAHVEERIGIHVKVNTFDPVDPIVVGSHDLALVGHFQDAGTNVHILYRTKVWQGKLVVAPQVLAPIKNKPQNSLTPLKHIKRGQGFQNP